MPRELKMYMEMFLDELNTIKADVKHVKKTTDRHFGVEEAKSGDTAPAPPRTPAPAPQSINLEVSQSMNTKKHPFSSS